ncbi:hypothetical protein Sjap_007518 [Stephania japonica]|uniref:Pentatricopeptide repeat-containing protein n=1 Tax=Stephania japonica TaxID=461633 RepID=A0AAP0JNC8_9MAGN
MGVCHKVFDEMPQPDVVSWTILIEGNRNAGRVDDALLAFEQMMFSGVLPNRVSMVNALSACAGSGALETGVWIHEYVTKNGWELDVILGTSLIDMYGKCGRMDLGLNVFKGMSEKNVFTWNSVIKGLALAKSGEEAVNWFFRMQEEGVKVDEVTLLGVLCACSHSGLVEIGLNIFYSMTGGKYGFLPGLKHYGCVVDLLGRAGRLEEAFAFIEIMPFEPTTAMWGALVAGCRAQGDLELSTVAATKLVEMEPNNGAYMVLLSNLYAEMGRWGKVEELRKLMKSLGFSASIFLYLPNLKKRKRRQTAIEKLELVNEALELAEQRVIKFQERHDRLLDQVSSHYLCNQRLDEAFVDARATMNEALENAVSLQQMQMNILRSYLDEK